MFYTRPERMFTDFKRGVYSRGDGKDISVPGRLEFTVNGQDTTIVSGLRRAIMTDVVTAAFEFDAVNPSKQDVKIIHNTGALHNEIIGERVGLLPIHLGKKELVDFNPGSWKFVLDVENKGKRPMDVTTADFSLTPADDTPAGSLSAEKLFPADALSGRRPIITVLMPGQRLSLEAVARLGSGREHARFNPAAACSMHPVPNAAAVERERQSREDKAYFDAIDSKRMIDTDGKGAPKSHRFGLESQCGMTPEEIVEAAFEMLATRFRSLSSAADGGDAVSDVDPQAGSPPDIIGLKLSGQDHTAGAILQERLLRITDFAGYYTPHILSESIVIRMRVPKGFTARAMLREACESAASVCDAALEEWQKATRKAPASKKI